MRIKLSVSTLVCSFIFLLNNIVSAQVNSWSCVDSSKIRGLTVDNFIPELKSPSNAGRANFNLAILGNKDKENALLFYAKVNNFNYLSLHGTELIFAEGDSSYNAYAYRQKLADFIINANGLGIEIGLGFDQGLLEWTEEFNKLSQENRARAFAKSNATIPRFSEASKKALSNIIDFSDALKSGGFNNGKKSLSGIVAIQVSMNWWEYPAAIADTIFDSSIKPLLEELNRYKTQGKITRVEARHGTYDYMGQANPPTQGELTLHYYSWARGIMNNADRLLFSDHTSIPENIGTNPDLDLMFSIYKGEVESEEMLLEIVPLFSAASSKFYDEKTQAPYSNHLGDSLAKGGIRGESVQRVHARINKVFDDNAYESDYFKLVGYHWDAYTIMPLKLYNASLNSGSVVSDSLISDKLLDFYAKQGPVLLEVYNNQRRVGEGTSNSSVDSNIYAWYGARSIDPLVANTLIRNVTTPYYEVPENFTAAYYVESKDNMGCPTVSIPVRVNYYKDGLWMKDFDDVEDVGEEPNAVPGQLWTSPDIWVNTYPNRGDLRNSGAVNDTNNYVHVRIRNLSNQTTSGSEQLELYYLKSTATPTWPAAWLNNSKDLQDGLGTRIIGDRINLYAVTIPAIPARSDTILVVEWPKNFIPQVADTVVDPYEAPSRKYRILARILKNNNPENYGMTTKEIASSSYNMISNNTVAGAEITIFKKDEFTTTDIASMEQSTFEIYPNPSAGLVNIKSKAGYAGKVKVSIANTLGQKLISEKEISLSGDNVEQIDLTSYPSGNYLLIIQDQNFNLVRHIVLQH